MYLRIAEKDAYLLFLKNSMSANNFRFEMLLSASVSLFLKKICYIQVSVHHLFSTTFFPFTAGFISFLLFSYFFLGLP